MSKTDIELIARMCVDISGLHKAISTLFSNKNDPVLKHLASSAVHMTLFMKDVFNSMDETDKILIDDELIKKFMIKCGCGVVEDKK